jgi:hypothetical protein
MKTQGGEGEYKACASRGYLPYRDFYRFFWIDIVCLKRFDWCRVASGGRSRVVRAVGGRGGSSRGARRVVTSWLVGVWCGGVCVVWCGEAGSVLWWVSQDAKKR